jgi:hypothetical protein
VARFDGKARRTRQLAAASALITALALLCAGSASAAVPDFLLQSPEEGIAGSDAGQMSAPWSIAADPNLPGDVYVADNNNHRIDEFTPWGEFVRAWGWGVKDGSSEFQVCTTATDCEQGIAGGEKGQFKNPEGITVDTSGNVYVLEGENHRVQKFDSEGNFILTLGFDVNKTKEGGGTQAERNVCTQASNDVCQAGKEGSGPGELQFGFPSYTNRLTVSTVTGVVFVAGEEEKRIQAFNPNGSFKEEIKGSCLEGKAIKAMTSDASGNLYVAFAGGAEVRKLKPTGPVADCLSESKFAANDVFALAVGPEGHLFALAGEGSGEPPRVLEFDPGGQCLNCGEAGEGGKSGFDRSPGFLPRGLAVGSACGPTDVYVNHAVGGGAFFKAFGEPPNAELCPQPNRPPEIKSQYALSAETTDATVQAEINPRFWPDTRYYVEYGTDLCSAGGCTSQQPVAPGSLLTAKTTQAPLKSAAVLLEGLSPATTYHYRFVAESEGGGPVFGTGSEPSFGAGGEASFTTFAKPGAEACPANEAFRTGTSALLPDCRAYELVSPLDKASGDVIALPEFSTELPSTLDQSSLDANKLAYGSYRSFAGDSAPFTTQYIAERGAGGWQSHSISPPRERITLFPTQHIDTELKALSPDLCESWWRTLAEPEPPLDSAAVSHYPNLYRRTDGDCGPQLWEALTTVAPPSLPTLQYYPLELQGRSADGTATIYVANDSLEGSGATPQPAGCNPEAVSPVCRLKLYYRKAGEAIPRYVCILPGGSAHAGDCSAGTYGADLGKGRMSNLQGAISADGSRVFWSTFTGPGGPGQIYLRENPAEPQSALANGAASGTGTLTAGSATVTSLIAAQGKATFTVGSPTATLTETTVGQFVAGQPLTALGKVPSGTTILSVEGSTLTLSANATGTGEIKVSSKGPLPFAVGQEISGAGIAPDTTIEAVALGQLTLSKPAGASGSAVALTAGSPCTEAAKACTIAVSQEAEALSDTSASRFWAAAADGSRAIFASGGNALTNAGGDLYSFEVDTQTTALIAGKVFGVVGTSADARRVYFVTEEACGGAGQAGDRNLYLYEAGEECAAGEMAFVAALAAPDVDPEPIRPSSSALALQPSSRSTRVTPDGLAAAFMSNASLTG